MSTRNARRKTIKCPAVVVKWIDSATPKHDGWVDIGEALKFEGETIISVGYLVRKDPNWVVLVGAWTASDDVSGRFAIPRKCVKSIRRLEEK